MVESKNKQVLEQAAAVLRSEATAILDAIKMLDDSFCKAIELLRDCTGSVVVTGMGKAGLIGRKISATLASTGTPSHFLHPAEAMHGDL
ncbi:MAG: KpsF/GutQ family sugar-phosphate isomerase, partial [Planctomycetaceae bacterium]|nr:KpsF/GutQ family sugar-phosphate isomerase [Planctomycetaceae bacterium]